MEQNNQEEELLKNHKTLNMIPSDVYMTELNDKGGAWSRVMDSLGKRELFMFVNQDPKKRMQIICLIT